MIAVHRFRKTWNVKVNRYIALTEFARDLFVQNLQLALDHISVKPNATADPGIGKGDGGYALFVGRLSPEKGISVMLEAAELGLGMPLKVAGTGPLKDAVIKAERPGVLEYLDSQSQESVYHLMKGARVLLMPSLWYEGLPMVIPEAFGTGLPVIASQIGALKSLVSHEQNGLGVLPGDAMSLAQAAQRLSGDRALEALLRTGARMSYETYYRPEPNVKSLLEIYHAVLDSSKLK